MISIYTRKHHLLIRGSESNLFFYYFDNKIYLPRKTGEAKTYKEEVVLGTVIMPNMPKEYIDD